MRILVVDDSALYRKILTDAASSALGTEAVAVSNGESALKKLESEKFDLVLLDLMMPNVSGIQVLEVLRDQGRLESLPVIMVSASNEMAGVVRCIELGAEDYLTKPIRVDALVEALMQVGARRTT